MAKKGAARAAADKGADTAEDLLPSTNGSQHDLHQFLRALAGDMELSLIHISEPTRPY